MLFGEAKTLLNRMRADYRAFQQLEDVIVFCEDLHGTIESQQAAINELNWKIAELSQENARMEDENAFGQKKLEELHEEFLHKKEELVRLYKEADEAERADFNSRYQEHSEKLAALKKAIDEKTKLLSNLDSQVNQAENQLKKAQRDYRAFKSELF